MRIRHLTPCLLVFVACGSYVPDPAPSTTTTSNSSARQSTDDFIAKLAHAPLGVAFQATNGNTVALYDTDELTGAREIGSSLNSKRTTVVALSRKDLLHQHRYTELFTAVTPSGTPVPDALVAFQTRHPVIIAVTTTTLGDPTISRSGGTPANNPLANGAPVQVQQWDFPLGGLHPISPIPSTWCGNGCCDSNWIGNLCGQNNFPTSVWFQFDYLDGEVSTGSTYAWSSLLCPIAEGASRWDVLPSDQSLESIFTSVNVGSWQAFDIAANTPSCNGNDFCEAYSVSSQVNDSSDEREETYCGSLSWL